MKKLLSLGILMMLCVSAAFSQAEITFEEQIHDFGKIKEENGAASTVFKFKNTGSAPLTLTNVSASCGCTVPEWPKEPIAAGGTGEIKATYNTKGRPGFFNKSITVKSNATAPSVVLNIKGEVIPLPKPATPAQ